MALLEDRLAAAEVPPEILVSEVCQGEAGGDSQKQAEGWQREGMNGVAVSILHSLIPSCRQLRSSWREGSKIALVKKILLPGLTGDHAYLLHPGEWGDDRLARQRRLPYDSCVDSDLAELRGSEDRKGT